MQLMGWVCWGNRKILRLFELSLPVADAQALHFFLTTSQIEIIYTACILSPGNAFLSLPKNIQIATPLLNPGIESYNIQNLIRLLS
jgi:hypothetical protein